MDPPGLRGTGQIFAEEKLPDIIIKICLRTHLRNLH